MNVSATSLSASLWPTSAQRSGTVAESTKPTEQSPATKIDVTNMSPSEMDDFAMKLFRAGEISLTEGSKLTIVGHLGRVGPNGEALPSNVDRDVPMDYLQYIEGRIDYMEAEGLQHAPKSGYQDYADILSVLREYA